MNSDPNSDPKQCTVSKLGRMHNAGALPITLRAEAVRCSARSRVVVCAAAHTASWSKSGIFLDLGQ